MVKTTDQCLHELQMSPTLSSPNVNAGNEGLGCRGSWRLWVSHPSVPCSFCLRAGPTGAAAVSVCVQCQFLLLRRVTLGTSPTSGVHPLTLPHLLVPTHPPLGLHRVPVPSRPQPPFHVLFGTHISFSVREAFARRPRGDASAEGLLILLSFLREEQFSGPC